MLGIEYASVAALFDSSVMREIIAETEREDAAGKLIGWVGLIAVCSLSAATFYYDYQINLASFNVKVITNDHIILSIVMIFMSELFFWISNVCEKAVKDKPKIGGLR